MTHLGTLTWTAGDRRRTPTYYYSSLELNIRHFGSLTQSEF